MNLLRISLRLDRFPSSAAWLAALGASGVLAPYAVGRAAPTEVPVTTVEDVMATDREFAQRAVDAGLRAAYERYLAADAVVYRPLPVSARDWLATHEPASGRLDWAPATAYVACDGSLAVTLGLWTYTARDGHPPDTGQYLTVWRPGPDGEWRIVLDQSISVAALPTAPARANAPCDDSNPSLSGLLDADRKLNGRVRSLPASAQPARATSIGAATGSARADLAVTHGELLERQAARGTEPQVRAVYVRLWQREGRRWGLLHDFVSGITP